MRSRTITYNGVVFPYSRMQVQENPLYADDGTTQIGADYFFSVSGYVIGSSVSDFQSKLAAMRGALQMPRAAFTVEISDGTTPVTLYEFGAGHDDDWGPIPGPLRFSQHAHTSCRYDWSVKCQRKEKWYGTQVLDSDVILSLTRRYQFSVDANGLTTRTISGTLICSSRGTPADKWRHLCVPDAPSWFERKNQSWEQSPDARALNFSVTDQETYWTLPPGVTQGEASFHVHLENSAIVTYTLSGYFAAPIDVWKPSIIEHIRNLIDQRFPANTFFDSIDLTDDIYGNRITFSVSGKAGGTVNPGNAGQIAGIEALAGFGQRPPDSTGAATIPGAYGGHGTENSGVSAGDMILYDAAGAQQFADDNISPPPGAGASAEAYPKTDGSWTPPSADPNVSDEQKASPYIHYHEQISYELDNGIKVFRSKASNGNPLIQQAYSPVLTIIQAGTATRLSRTAQYLPKAPKPILANTDGAVVQAYVSPTTGEVVNNDFSRFTVNWRYIITARITPSTATAVKVPTTPIRPEQADNWTLTNDDGSSPFSDLI